MHWCWALDDGWGSKLCGARVLKRMPWLDKERALTIWEPDEAHGQAPYELHRGRSVQVPNRLNDCPTPWEPLGVWTWRCDDTLVLNDQSLQSPTDVIFPPETGNSAPSGNSPAQHRPARHGCAEPPTRSANRMVLCTQTPEVAPPITCPRDHRCVGRVQLMHRFFFEGGGAQMAAHGWGSSSCPFRPR